MREGASIHTGDLRDVDEARRGDPRLLARHPPGRDRRRDRELPQAPVHAVRGQPRALQRGLPGGDRRGRRALHLRVLEHGVRERRAVPDARGLPAATARRRARPTAGRSSRARSTAAPRTTSSACRSRSAGPFNAYGPGEMPDAEPGIAHAVPDLIRKSLGALRPLPIFGSGEQTRTLTHVDDIADGIVTATAHPAGLNEDFNISASRGADGRRDRAHLLGGVRQRPGRVRARAPAELRGRRPAPLAVGREGRAAARLARADRRARGDRRQTADVATGPRLARRRPGPAARRSSSRTAAG